MSRNKLKERMSVAPPVDSANPQAAPQPSPIKKANLHETGFSMNTRRRKTKLNRNSGTNTGTLKKTASGSAASVILNPKNSQKKFKLMSGRKAAGKREQNPLDADYDFNAPTVIKEKKGTRLPVIVAVSIISIYLCVLIYGAILTDYTYAPSGRVQPVVYTLSMLEERGEYIQAASYYTEFQAILKDYIRIDGEIIADVDAAPRLAMQYEDNLDTLDKLIYRVESANYDASYAGIYHQMLDLSDYLGLYGLSKSNYYLSRNDEDYITAVQAMAAMIYGDETSAAKYNSLSANLANIASAIPKSETYADLGYDPIADMQERWGFTVADQIAQLNTEGALD